MKNKSRLKVLLFINSLAVMSCIFMGFAFQSYGDYQSAVIGSIVIIGIVSAVEIWRDLWR